MSVQTIVNSEEEDVMTNVYRCELVTSDTSQCQNFDVINQNITSSYGHAQFQCSECKHGAYPLITYKNS
jgi:hypothetical protein